MKNPEWDLSPAAYRQQLAEKIQAAEHCLAEFAPPPAEVFASLPRHFRMRAEFRLWHHGETCSYAMFAKGQKPSNASVALYQDYPLASALINRAMPVLLQALVHNPNLKEKCFQVEFLSTLSEELLITLIYHKKLPEDFAQQLADLKQFLLAANVVAKPAALKLIARSRGQKIAPDGDFVTEVLPISIKDQTRDFHYRQYEGSFSQPNAQVATRMIEWALNSCADLGGDLLELYCGNGNFSLPLASVFERVLATEVSKTSVRAAKWNIAANDIGNLKIARLSSSEFASAYQKEREFVRLKAAQIDLPSYQFSTILVDPPRAGLDAATLQLVGKFANILYISCNMHTLAANLKTLCGSHQIRKLAFFDQFAYSDHLELGLLLSRIDYENPTAHPPR